jgi:hypothetical protein
MNRILPKLGWAALGLLVLMLVGLVVARIWFTHYLHSEAFRRSLGQGAANALHATRADFAPLEFDGALVYGENFRALRDDGGGFSSIDADQLRATFDWHGLLHHAVQIDELAIQRVNVEPPTAGGVAATPESFPGTPEAAPGAHGGAGGWTIDLRKATISEANWHWSDDPEGGITGAALTLTPDGRDAWIIDAQGGTLKQAGLPTVDLDSSSLRWQSPTLYINSATLRDGEGRLTVTGEIESRQSVDLQVKLDNVDVKPLLTPDWKERLSGKVGGEVHVQAMLGTADPRSSLAVTGTVSLTEGQLTALPVLDQLGVFAHTERFRQMELTRATASFSSEPGRLEVRTFVAEAEGLIRVEGDYTVRNGEIDGTFQVGLTPETLQWIPGSQDSIFTVSRDGYLWTPMRLTGPATHPVDDLTPRLIAAAGTGVIKGVQGTVEKAAQGILDFIAH